MFSPAGFLVGAALAALGLLFLIDAPHAERMAAAVNERTDDAINPSADAAPATALTSRSTLGVNPGTDDKVTVRDEPGSLPPEETRMPEQPALAATEHPPLVELQRALEGEEAARVEGHELAAPQRWHVFWRPFRSRLSAEGFARRVGVMTGLEVRVTEQTPGEFSVAFPYSDDQEKWLNIGTIELATGLTLSKGEE